ncbi:barstar family protein [Allobranchiibius sp. CTAmp26]|uniref:barstar family protein n=1 Tax=Allobranchiibius sp. CTAmp26 TaxID=2815214 RepID=UPI001AA1802A|nr:barstar family protein [Allobranchiibius sp. CTAmp26]MBO1755791.1 barstar family protein [Allobranchiibius sp. CTAmp26]
MTDGRRATGEGPEVVARLALARAMATAASGALILEIGPTVAAAEGERAGWNVVRLEAWGDRAAFLQACRRAFDLPDWFGHNWDALADSLSDVQHRPGTLVVWAGARELADDVRATATAIFAERADDGPAPFLVVDVGSER